MSYCIYKVLRPEGKHFIKQCTLCDTIIKSTSDAPDIPVFLCSFKPPRIKNAAKTAIQFAKSGFRVRSDEQIKELYDTYCNNPKDPCAYFQEGECVLCGCPVNRAKRHRNLLKIAVKGCPANPPRFKATIL